MARVLQYIFTHERDLVAIQNCLILHVEPYNHCKINHIEYANGNSFSFIGHFILCIFIEYIVQTYSKIKNPCNLLNGL